MDAVWEFGILEVLNSNGRRTSAVILFKTVRDDLIVNSNNVKSTRIFTYDPANVLKLFISLVNLL